MEKPEPIKKLIHDGEFSLATGRSRRELKWKNQTMTWSGFLERLSAPSVTGETSAEYKKLSKADRDTKKDVGGFVGGALKEGRRKAGNVANRTLITLDLDAVEGSAEGLWSNLTALNDYAVAVYSTHSHTPEEPRLRIVVPLSRPVTPDEYQAVARMLAFEVGIDQFDDTTYEPHRLMYWPSRSRDAEYFFRYQDGAWLDPGDILDKYLDWTDSTYWPESSRHQARINTLIKRQEDPLEKKGIIGAFCRTYDIHEAIERFIPGEYESAGEGRYTYVKGTGSKGAVTYEDKFLYSHHGTDPSSNMLCNAFDLVRIHRFGTLDENSKTDTPVNKLPSFLKMQEFASSDEGVKKVVVDEKLGEIETEFEFTETEQEKDPDAWKLDIKIDKNGKVLNTIENARTILLNSPDLKGRMGLNKFSSRYSVLGDLPWGTGKGRDWSDYDDAGIRNYFEDVWGITSAGKITDAVSLAFEEGAFHPIREYLTGLTWDGVERAGSVLIDYLGAEDSEYVRAVTVMHLVASVWRVFNPGCKYDYMLTLSGPQGIGKSTLIRYLCGDEYFNDSIAELKGKDTMEQLQGSWLIELGEMSATRKADVETVKQFISKTEDNFRPAYARRAQRFLRQCVFWGSTNDTEFLRDKTGNRRFLPVTTGVNKNIKDVFSDLPRERDQIWAEIMEISKGFGPLKLSREMEVRAHEIQEAHAEESSKKGLILEYLDKGIPLNWYSWTMEDRRAYINNVGTESAENFDDLMKRSKISVIEIWYELFNGDPKSLTPIQSREINDILRSLKGWKMREGGLRFGPGYGRQRGYISDSGVSTE